MLNSVTKLFFVVAIALLVARIDGVLKLPFDNNIRKFQESGSKCLLNLARRFIDPASIITIMSSGLKTTTNPRVGVTTKQIVLKKLMEEESWTVMTKTTKTKHGNLNTFKEKVHAYILFSRTLNDLAAILAHLNRTSSWNPHANFVLYMDIGIVRAEREILLVKLINLAWKYLIINLTIIIPDTEKLNQQIVTWFPFDEENCGKQEIQTHLLGVCEENELIPPNTNYFPQKVPLNLHNCAIKVGTLTWPPFILAPTKNITGNHSEIIYNFENGIEIEIIKTIAKHANFTIAFKSLEEPENWGTVEHNGTGLIGMLMRKEVDIAIATFTPTKTNHEHFDFSFQYTQDKTTWLVPTPDLIPQWRSMVGIFQPQAWVLSVFIYIIVSIVTYLLGMSSSQSLEHTKYRHPYGTFLITWRILCGSGSPTFPKTGKIKLFLVLWLLYCMHWCTAYTTYLISMLTTPMYYQQMSSFNDIMGSGMEYGMQQSTTRYFQKTEFIINHIDDILIKNYKLCDSAARCLARIATKRDFAMAISRQYFEFIQRNYEDQFGNPLIQPFHDDIVTSPVEMLLVKGHPLLPRINEMLHRIVQAGLVDIWTKQIQHDVSLQDIDSTTQLKPSQKLYNKKVLTFYHLQGAFMTLGFGLFIAFIQFMLEILFHKRQANKINFNAK